MKQIRLSIPQRYLKSTLLLLCLIGSVLAHCPSGLAQNEDTTSQAVNTLKAPEKVTVHNVFIIGNEKTRKNIILREMDVAPGVEYDWEEFLAMVKTDQQRIYNLQLFTSVEITPLFVEDEEVELLVSVKERWYVIPSIIFDLADRNFSEWWINQNRDLSRVNYGLKLNHNNVGGRNEKLRVMGQLGFTQAFDLVYSIPYIDKDQEHGLALRINYNTNKTIAVKSAYNKQVFYTNEEEDILRKNLGATVQYTYRGNFYNFNYLTLGYSNTKIHEDVLTQNPNYFLNDSTRQKYFYASYNFKHDRRDNIAYATQGELINVGVTRYGLFTNDDVNETEIALIANKYFRFSDKTHLVTGISASSYLSSSQPYTLVRGIGYSPDFIRGYEINVIEGQQTIIHKNSFRYKLLDVAYDISKLIPIEEFSTFPIRAYLSANFDHGYVNDRNHIPENAALTNTYLYGYGLGLDLVTFYDQVFRFEYSINSQQVGSFFINIKAPL
ncbi:BamA/TamA family outer membrane protein [Echinicola soli]|uniref:BamA/TamA family outer membrane protein n=1 Tax=Echinicola soli TaxID=2591634 RepID=A0A514CIA0_9BACT|nr:BamA/TamA family outer membrane protein [Echinicola soli]QDH79516.1 BamA/TamA family outer membrane protein [Echinicola soli]